MPVQLGLNLDLTMNPKDTLWDSEGQRLRDSSLSQVQKLYVMRGSLGQLRSWRALRPKSLQVESWGFVFVFVFSLPEVCVWVKGKILPSPQRNGWPTDQHGASLLEWKHYQEAAGHASSSLQSYRQASCPGVVLVACVGISWKGPLLATRLKLVFRVLPLWKTFLATCLVLLSSRTSLSVFCLPNKGWLSQWKKHLLNPLEQSIPMTPYALAAKETRAKFVKISSAEHSVLETINSFWFLQIKSI